MNTITKIKYLLLFILMSSSIAFSQVTITTIITPPFSNHSDDYASTAKSNVMLTSTTTTMSVYPQVVITGTNGITIKSINNSSLYNFSGLTPGVPVMLTSVQLSQLFDRNKLVVTGMDRTQMAEFLANGTIPNGSYSMCFEAWSFGAAPFKASNPSPNGCTNILLGNPTTSFNKSLNEAPKTIMPMCNTDVILTTPQNIVFTWLNPSAAFQLGNDDLSKGLQEYSLKIVEVVGNKTANEAIKTATTPPFFEKTILGTSYVYGPADPPLKPNTKYAYTISVKNNPKQYQNNGVSDACMFTCKSQTLNGNLPPPTPPNGTPPPPATPKYGIILLNPIQGKKILSGYGLDFSWKPANNFANYYLLQFTDSYSQDKKITDWSKLSDELFTGKNAFYASSPDPKNDIKGNPIMDTKYSLSPSWTNGTGKIAWRIVACDKSNKHIDSSGIESYEIIPDTTDLKITDFMMCGFGVHVLQITNKDTSKFSCTGEFYLWEGGPKITKQFDNLKLRPFTYYPKLKKYGWVATSGTLFIDDLWHTIYSKSIIDLEPDENTDGNYSLRMNKLKMVADINCVYNPEKKLFEVIKDNSTCKINSQLTWQTDWFIWNISNFSDVQYEIQSETKELDFTFKDKFVQGKLFLQKDETIETATKGGISILFSSGANPTFFWVKGFSVSANLTGTVAVPNSKPISEFSNTFISLAIPFIDRSNMNFKTKINPLNWYLNMDGSVTAKVDEVIVHLGNGKVDGKDISNQTVGILVPNFKTTLKYPSNFTKTETKDITFTFGKVYNGGDGFRTNGYVKDEKIDEYNLCGFYAKSNLKTMALNKNKLIDLLFMGDMYVPFLNENATCTIEADKDKVYDASISFKKDEHFLIGSEGSNQYFSIKSYDVKLVGSRVELLNPDFNLYNSEQKGVTGKQIDFCNLYISPDANVSISPNAAYDPNGCYIWNQPANYYKFDYTITDGNIQTLGDNNYRVSLGGNVVLGPKIATKSKEYVHFDFHRDAPAVTGASVKEDNPQNTPYNININDNSKIVVPKNTPIPKNINNSKGPYPNDASVENTEDNASIDFQQDGDGVSGEYEDGGQSFGGSFKLVKGDPVWGDYFSLAGHYYTKEPNATELNASMILGKIKNYSDNYTYWYVDFFQKGVVTIPVIPGIAEINGFGGKAYYHMKVQHDNNGKIISLNPDNNNSLGIEAEALFRTSFDQGRTFHGHTSIIVGFNGWSLGPVSYYLQGEILAPNDNSGGLLHCNIKAFFDWKNKSFNTIAAVWGNVYGILCVNGNNENYNTSFKLNKSGIDAWVGAPEDPITLSVLCNINTGAWAHVSNNWIGAGFTVSRSTGWHGINVIVIDAEAKLDMSASGGANIQFSPLDFNGSLHASGSADGSICIGYSYASVCYSPHASVSGDFTVKSINPFSATGKITVDLKHIPNFSVAGTVNTNAPYFHLNY